MEIKSTYNLFLDDERMPRDAFNYTKDFDYNLLEWVIVRNYKQFCETIEAKFKFNEWPVVVSFDHDLQGEHYEIAEKSGFKDFDYSLIKEGTGRECAKWLTDFCLDHDLKLPPYKVHSGNTVGKRNILGLLDGFAKFQSKS